MSSPDAPIEKQSGIDAIFDASATSPILRSKPLTLPVMTDLDMKSFLLKWNIAVWALRELVLGSVTLMDENDHLLTAYIGRPQLTQC